jgi:transposase-like protein
MVIKSDGCSEFIVDETVNKIGSQYIWLWIAIEPTNKEILGFSISKERNIFVAERFLFNLSEGYWQTLFQQMVEPGIYKLASF